MLLYIRTLLDNRLGLRLIFESITTVIFALRMWLCSPGGEGEESDTEGICPPSSTFNFVVWILSFIIIIVLDQRWMSRGVKEKQPVD